MIARPRKPTGHASRTIGSPNRQLRSTASANTPHACPVALLSCAISMKMPGSNRSTAFTRFQADLAGCCSIPSFMIPPVRTESETSRFATRGDGCRRRARRIVAHLGKRGARESVRQSRSRASREHPRRWAETAGVSLSLQGIGRDRSLGLRSCTAEEDAIGDCDEDYEDEQEEADWSSCCCPPQPASGAANKVRRTVVATVSRIVTDCWPKTITVVEVCGNPAQYRSAGTVATCVAILGTFQRCAGRNETEEVEDEVCDL